MEVRAKNGVLLMSIPVSPNSDYMAGEDGRIYSRTKYAGFGRKTYVDWYPLKGRRPKPRGNKKGYITISLCHENKKVTKTVHKLVCMAFHGMPPTASTQVRHLNGDSEDNLPTNLCWGTQYENWEDRRAHGRVALGETHHAAKLKDVEREHLRWALAKGLCSARQAARMLGLGVATVQEIASG